MDITVIITITIMVRQRQITLALQIRPVLEVIKVVVVENSVMKMTVSVAV